jgi:hypothetical protein
VQSRVLPVLLLIASVFGCVYSADHGQELAFACWTVLGCIGWQELRNTNEFNEQQ